jgi:hypothetical protein
VDEIDLVGELQSSLWRTETLSEDINVGREADQSVYTTLDFDAQSDEDYDPDDELDADSVCEMVRLDDELAELLEDADLNEDDALLRTAKNRDAIKDMEKNGWDNGKIEDMLSLTDCLTPHFIFVPSPSAKLSTS